MNAARDVPPELRRDDLHEPSTSTAQALAKVPAIEVLGIGKRFGDAQILSDIRFSVAPGEVVALIGPSGCGKSTLLNILSGLMAPDAGTFSIDGRPHDRFDGWRRVAYMFQEDRLLPWRSVRANVALGLEAAGVPKPARARRVDAALALVGLDAQGDAWPHQLSGGMRSRVALARSLVVQPTLLLMDEPFSKLDPATRSQMHGEVLRIQAMTRETHPERTRTDAAPMTIVFVTHDMEEAVVLADRIVLLAPHPGRIAGILPVDLSRPRVPTDATVAEQVRQLRLRT